MRFRAKLSGMGRLACVYAVVCLAACQDLFHLEHLRDATGSAAGDGAACTETPRQDVTGVASTANQLHMTFSATKPGSTLVLIVATATSSYNVDHVADAAANLWAHQVSLRTATTNGTAALDIFYAENAGSITSLDALLPPGAQKSMAASLTEWQCPTMTPFDGAAQDPGTTSTSATSGSLVTNARDLVIGAIVFGDAQAQTSAPMPAAFVPLTPFATASQTGARAAYAWQPPGTFQVQWMLSSSLDWVGGILALNSR